MICVRSSSDTIGINISSTIVVDVVLVIVGVVVVVVSKYHGGFGLPPAKKKGQKEQRRHAREKSSKTRAETMGPRTGEQNRACVGYYSLKLTTVGRKLCPLTEMSYRRKVDDTCVRGRVMPIYGNEESQEGRRNLRPGGGVAPPIPPENLSECRAGRSPEQDMSGAKTPPLHPSLLIILLSQKGMWAYSAHFLQ